MLLDNTFFTITDVDLVNFFRLLQQRSSFKLSDFIINTKFTESQIDYVINTGIASQNFMVTSLMSECKLLNQRQCELLFDHFAESMSFVPCMALLRHNKFTAEYIDKFLSLKNDYIDITVSECCELNDRQFKYLLEKNDSLIYEFIKKNKFLTKDQLRLLILL